MIIGVNEIHAFVLLHGEPILGKLTEVPTLAAVVDITFFSPDTVSVT
jgi:hypothetical protein